MMLPVVAVLCSGLVAPSSAADLGGYVRVATRPDLQGGEGTLGYWNLYGRLPNEGPWVAGGWRQARLEGTPGAEWAGWRARVGQVGRSWQALKRR